MRPASTSQPTRKSVTSGDSSPANTAATSTARLTPTLPAALLPHGVPALRQTTKPHLLHLQLHHVVGAGATLATGIMGVWALNVLGLTGEFVVVLSTPGVVYLAAYVLVTSIVSCWLLFRVLVWKPSYEYLRPLCSAFFALSLWSVDYSEYTAAKRGGGGRELPSHPVFAFPSGTACGTPPHTQPFQSYRLAAAS